MQQPPEPPVVIVPIEDFSLAQHAGDYRDWPRTTPLLRGGAPTGVEVPGYCLLRQYAVGERTLLITDWDCPYEEATEVLLLDAQLRVVARKQFGVPYASFWLTDAAIADGGRALELVLCERERWRVEVLERRPWLLGSLLQARREP
ncbi:MAG: hypothetical protein KDD82_00705 [Planctomycetes bacterium]|nr:hypothetical protein [Planctomycetota bacterium]